ncbi:MAG TPA: hypothetical protein VJL58_05315 [Pyrinomonadaceae bacterium]|nr:hypothetical protein [Pyrinomonadaceae bacterium]
MAYRFDLPTPYFGLKYIWNVSDTVGDQPSCKNNPTDVDLIALLLGGAIRATDLGSHIHPSCRQPFQVNGKMDINIAYWIRLGNALHKKELSQSDAGIISRAKKSSFFNGDTWTIIKLNNTMFLHMRSTWEDLPNHPQCPPALRKELLTKTSP